jgi:hypothetical protein
MIKIKCFGRVEIEGEGKWPEDVELKSNDEIELLLNSIGKVDTTDANLECYSSFTDKNNSK